jgi:hypothetical protein
MPSHLPAVLEEQAAFAAHIGIDWADQKHFWAMRAADGPRHRGQLDHTPEAVEVWAAGLAQRFGGLRSRWREQARRGAVIAKLTKYAHLVLFPVHANKPCLHVRLPPQSRDVQWKIVCRIFDTRKVSS